MKGKGRPGYLLVVGLLWLTVCIGWFVLLAEEEVQNPWLQIIVTFILITFPGWASRLQRAHWPRSALRWFSRGRRAGAGLEKAWAHMEREEFERAIDALTQVIQLRPQWGKAYMHRSINFYNLERYAEALNDLNDALRLDPALTHAYLWRFNVHDALGNRDLAVKDVEECLRRDPDNVDALLLRASVSVEKGELDKALADTNYAASLNPSDPSLYFMHGLVFLKMKKYDQAIQDFTEGLGRRPPQPIPFYCRRGLAWFGKGDYQRALDDLNLAVSLGEEDLVKKKNTVNRQLDLAMSYKDLAWFLATCPVDDYRDGSKAFSLARKAMEISKEKEKAWFEALAAASAEIGDIKGAIAWQKRFLEEGRGEKSEGQKRLKMYQDGQPYREPSQ